MSATSYTTSFASPPVPHLTTRFVVTFDGTLSADATISVSDPAGGSLPDGNSFVVASGSQTGSIGWIPSHSGTVTLTHNISGGSYANRTPAFPPAPQVGGGDASPVFRQ